MTTPLLQTKFYIPPVRPELVPRPHLIERLNAGLHRKLTLISAPAGFGKTTLLSEWVSDFRLWTADFGLGANGAQIRDPKSEIRNRVAWVSLDEGDNDPARFLSYFVAALQTIEANIGEGILSALQSPQPPSMEELLTALINQVSAIPDQFTLVLDDYHLITAQPIHDVLTFLLDHLPGDMHLVIATRADPPLPIARLRGRGQLTELRQADLRFTADEVTEFLNQIMGLGLSADDVAALAFRTEGWIAGLQMVAVSMQGREDISGFIAEFTGSQHYILDYLIEEVLQRQPEGVQSFLLQTSILERMSGPLCDAVTGTGNSHAMLEHLEHANLFVFPLDDNQNWYRYHILFADLLRHRLLEVQPDLVPTLHRRASEWYERNGQVAEAIDHAMSARDFERAACLVELAAEQTMMRSEVATFLSWVEALPDEVVHARPLLHAYQAGMQLMSGRPVQVVEKHLQKATEADPAGLVSGAVSAFRAMLAAYQGDTRQSIELSQQALELLPEGSLFLRGMAAGIRSLGLFYSGDVVAAKQALEEAVRISERAGNLMNAVLAVCHLADLCTIQGQLGEAKAFYDKALELAVDRRGQPQPIAGIALIGLGAILREWNELEDAAHHFIKGIELASKFSKAGIFNGYVGLAYVRQAQGDVRGAREAMQTAQQVAIETEAIKVDDALAATYQAHLWVIQGDLEAAMRWVKKRGLALSPALSEACPERSRREVEGLGREVSDGSLISSYPRCLEYLTLARLYMAQGWPEAALKVLQPLLQAVETRGWTKLVINILVLQAIALQTMGDTLQALTALERALSLAEPGDHVRIFVDEGEPMRVLIADFRLRIEKQARNAQEELSNRLAIYADKLLAAFPASAPAPRPAIHTPKSEMVEPLSERELEVLRLLATELSSTDIAQELVVSVNTVRSHIKSIYSKLDVHSRYEAVARAKGLNLL